MSDSFTFDGVSSASFLARVFPTDTMTQAPARIYESVSVPGRSGDLLIDRKAFENHIIEYDVVISGDSDFTKLMQLRSYLTSRSGYKRLTDTFDTTHYRMAAYMEPFAMTGDWASMRRGRGTIAFNCKPQRYLLSGETAVVMTAAGTITNPTRFEAKPLLVVTTSASGGRVSISGVTITINYVGTTTIDCETGRAYDGATPLDSLISINSNDFPVLKPGSNGVSISSDVSRLEITPRWWEI